MHVDTSFVTPVAAQSHPEIDIDYELTKGFAAQLIRKKAKQIARRAGFCSSDQDDIEQELKLQLWNGFQKFDANKAHWNAFVTTVIERHVGTILRQARRIKRRQPDNQVSLSELVEDQDNELVELGETVGPQHQEGLTGRWVDSAENQFDLKLDVAEVVANLPVDLRPLCELLKTYTVQDVARLLILPRTTVIRRVERLREIFCRAGFEEFLKGTCDARSRNAVGKE